MGKKSNKPAPIVTRQSLQDLLDSKAGTPELQHVIGRALVCLYQRQTSAEQSRNTTDEDNGVGFASCDALSGSRTAKSYMQYGRLLQWQIEAWGRRTSNGFARICKYHKQLNEVAEAKAASKAARLLHAQQSVIEGM